MIELPLIVVVPVDVMVFVPARVRAPALHVTAISLEEPEVVISSLRAIVDPELVTARAPDPVQAPLNCTAAAAVMV